MQEHAKKLNIDVEIFPIKQIPTVYRTTVKSDEPLGSQHNLSKISSWIKKNGALTDNQQAYILAIYLELGRNASNISSARGMLINEDPSLFEGRKDRMTDISILKKLLVPPTKWVAHSAVKNIKPE